MEGRDGRRVMEGQQRERVGEEVGGEDSIDGRKRFAT